MSFIPADGPKDHDHTLAWNGAVVHTREPQELWDGWDKLSDHQLVWSLVEVP